MVSGGKREPFIWEHLSIHCYLLKQAQIDKKLCSISWQNTFDIMFPRRYTYIIIQICIWKVQENSKKCNLNFKIKFIGFKVLSFRLSSAKDLKLKVWAWFDAIANILFWFIWSKNCNSFSIRLSLSFIGSAALSWLNLSHRPQFDLSKSLKYGNRISRFQFHEYISLSQ